MQRGAVEALHKAGEGFISLGFKEPAFAAYGAIYKLQYWQGVVDQLGGPNALRTRRVRLWREGRLDTPTGSGQAA